MTSRLASVAFKMASKVFIEETDKNFEFITEILFRFRRFGDFKVPIVIENWTLVLFWNETSSGVINFKAAGLKCTSQVTGQVTGYRLQATGQVTGQVTGHRPQVRLQVTGQITGHRSGHRSHTKTIRHSTNWTDVLLYKNKISLGNLTIFLSFKQY